jgi:hypothetical protein
VGPYFLDPLERKAIIRPLASLYADWYGPEKRKENKKERIEGGTPELELGFILC